MIAKVELHTKTHHNRTVLKTCFCTPPFKVLDITENKQESTLHLMLMNASPGVLNGDFYHIKIHIDSNCSLQLHTQSFQRLFQMKQSASQCMDVSLEEGSSFQFLPHPAVPHKGSSFTAQNNIYIKRNCTLIWGEVLTCGRKESGEAFQFSKYHSLTKIFINNRLVIKENLLLQPLLVDVTEFGQLEGYTHQASLIHLHESAPVPHLLDACHALLLVEKDLCFGITALPVNGLMVRMLGFKGEQLHGVLKKLAHLISKSGIKEVHHNDTVYAN